MLAPIITIVLTTAAAYAFAWVYDRKGAGHA